MKLNISNKRFILILIVLNTLLAIYATPITDSGDESIYILLSRTFLGEATSVDLRYLQFRSPLYPIIMAGFMLLFKPPVLYKVMVVFNYILVAATAWMVYLIFGRLFQRKETAMLVALLFNLSFSTIYYANVLLTEILTVFLLVLSVVLLLHICERCKLKRLFALGISLGFLSLARFNTIPLIAICFILLAYVLIRKKVSFKQWAFSMGVLAFSFALIIGLLGMFNFWRYGTFRLIPNAKVGIPGISRKIVIASIRPENIVSDKNKPLLDIFLKARAEFLSGGTIVRKGSLAELDNMEFLISLYSGAEIYQLALPKLQSYLGQGENKIQSGSKPDLNQFFKEIAAQNNKFIIKHRFYSFFSGFRAASGGSLSTDHGKINLNILPSSAFITFKLLFIFISVFVLFAFFYFLFDSIKGRFKPDILLMILFFIVLSFWGINFVYATANDANRFKFPAEPLIIGLFVYYIQKLIYWAKALKRGVNEKNRS